MKFDFKLMGLKKMQLINNKYTQKDKELIHVYCIGIYSLALLDEYGKLERFGSLAKVYNTITKKFNVFHKQLFNYKHKKSKKISHKTTLFVEANKIADMAWSAAMKETLKTSILVDKTVYSLYFHNRDMYEKIYGIGEDDFHELKIRHVEGTTLSSSRVARILTEKTKQVL